MFARLKKKVLEEEEAAGGPERLGFSPRKLPGGAVAVRSPPATAEQPPVAGASEKEAESQTGGERERENKEETISQPLENPNLVRRTWHR